ncbi:HD domain-containing protein [Streptomyces longwoodensis]|uniref:HD domain-containing protein n=1 Tax=Streptomyces longwoodensis TaxID=68231 RepID=UPI0036EC3E1D
MVFTHCEIVCGIAEQLVAQTDLPLDADLVHVGALVHDIGVYRLYDQDGRLDHRNYIRHGVLGHEIREQKLAIPEADYPAETIEEQLVMYADKFHSRTTPPTFLTADSYAAHVEKLGADKGHAFDLLRARFGEPDQTSARARYGHAQV